MLKNRAQKPATLVCPFSLEPRYASLQTGDPQKMHQRVSILRWR